MAKRLPSAPPVLSGYSYVRPLGTGGFADVFLYEQDLPRRVTAVKVLLVDVVDPDARRSFTVEADAMARLSAHPSIVTIYQASISADGRPYFVMEYCPESLGARSKRGPMPVGEVLDIGVRMAGALETAHRSGLLHRDIKPSNLLVNSLGAPVLADFGIAGAISDDGTGDTFAMSIPWSAPEVLGERTTGTVATEIWSLGATLYTLLAGHSPFELPDRSRNTVDQLSRRVLGAKFTPLAPRGVPARIDTVLSTAMQRDPARRYGTMAEFGEALRWAQYELGVAPTSLEVASPEWAAAAPLDFADASERGPVVTTVNPDSRRAGRAAAVAAARPSGPRVDDGGLAPARARGGVWKPLLIGVGSAVVVIGLAAAGLVLSGAI
ncbi:serine/threonine-protein kinase [Agromyces sp. H3Y2-19a]|uniref:serine/threonine-protein kinase n=1 Tax=Agromyces TaxID=33877 RepID=UPI001E2DA283|nr:MULTISPECIES: serine/threonine-protein kinase [Agromyces]MCD5345247.1 serine/threonine protein kinase [Agromyces sp. S2-1-8]MDF0513594.1 serine/threonine-protein kinase [Agromyces chromiiresistens]